MYTSFYNLREEPFNLTADPRFFFYNEEYRKAFKYISYGIRNREGFVEILGDVGNGKTAFCHALMNQLGSDTQCIFIPHAYFSELEFLEVIADKLGIAHNGATQSELTCKISDYVLSKYSASQNVVLIFDEAQNLSPNLLQQIRLLSNVGGAGQKPLQVVLVGQLELEEKLRHAELRDVDQRISIRYRVKPLKRSELPDYIAHRIKIAGGKADEITFTGSAYYKIWRFSRGIPRLINVICDKSLLVGYLFRTRRITARVVDAAIRNTQERWHRFPAMFYYSSFQVALKIALTILLIAVGINWKYQDEFQGWIKKTGPTLGLIKAITLNPMSLTNKDVLDLSQHQQLPALPEEVFESAIRTYGDKDGWNKLCLAGLLKVWGVGEPYHNISQWLKDTKQVPVADIVYKYNLQITSLDSDLKDLEVINLPCILEKIYHADTDQTGSMVLLKLSPESAVLYHPAEGITSYTREEVEKRWSGRALILWKNVDNLPDKVLPDAQTAPAEVERIGQRLRQLGYGESSCNISDPQNLRQAILKFQQAHKLKPSGVLDTASKIALYRLLDSPSTPSLRQGGYGG